MYLNIMIINILYVVDIVYVGVIHPCHFPLIKLFLNSGKHVLCEKPLTVNAKQAKEVVDISRKKRLFLMEVSILYNYTILYNGSPK